MSARRTTTSTEQRQSRWDVVRDGPGHWAYAIARRAGLMEATRLLVGEWPPHASGFVANDRFQYSAPTAMELQERLDLHRCPASIGLPDAMVSGDRRVIVATLDEQVVGFVWTARGHVDAVENFSRTRALGTAISLPAHMAFLFNAWVEPSCRGQSLLASMILATAEHLGTDIRQMATTMDWTNQASLTAFKKLGMREVGIISRCGIGALQWVHAPAGALPLGLTCRTR